MKTMIRDLRDMTDSREMLEAKTSPFVAIFIYFILLVIVIALIWSYFGEIDEVVKATGVVRPNEKVSSIKTKVTGKAEEVNFLQGQRVEQGDVLFTLEREELELQKKALNEELAKLDKELSALASYKQSVLDNQNYISSEDDYYYNLFLQYQLDYQKLAAELDLNSLELDKSSTELARAELDNQLNYQLYESRMAEAELLLTDLQTLEKSIKEQKNLFSENFSDYYNKYQEYQLQLEQLQEITERAYQQMLISVEIGEEYLPKIQIEEDVRQYKLAKLDLDSYTNNYLLNVRTTINEQEQLITELIINIERTEENKSEAQIDQNYFAKQSQLAEKQSAESQQYSAVLLEKFQIDKVVAINEQIKLFNDRRTNILDQLKNLQISIQERIITSPINGIVNIVTEINMGDLIASGVELIKIVPETDSEYKVMLTVLNKDISNIAVGDEIKYHFLALPYKEYGEIKGKINKISIDSTMNPNDGISFYIVEASIDNQALYSYKGQEANIKVGMLSEAYVITDSKKILNYVLEKIDLRD